MSHDEYIALRDGFPYLLCVFRLGYIRIIYITLEKYIIFFVYILHVRLYPWTLASDIQENAFVYLNFFE